MLKNIRSGVLNVMYIEKGPSNGIPVLLLHGFPYDVHAYDEVKYLLSSEGCRVIIPYLRGYGPTRFLSKNTQRSGQQAALAYDLLALMDSLSIPKAVLAGYDWGGRAACIVSALWPERAIGLVSGGGYSIQNIPDAAKRQGPEDKLRLWYQYYFHTEDGQKRIAENRRDLCRLLWRLWSPNWKFNERTYMRSASSFENPDFVQVVIHSYRHRFSLVSGDPAFEKTERCLAEQPKISVPTIVIEGDADGVAPLGGYKDHHHYFTGKYERRVLPGVGHNSPQEAPRDFAEAVLSVI